MNIRGGKRIPRGERGCGHWQSVVMAAEGGNELLPTVRRKE